MQRDITSQSLVTLCEGSRAALDSSTISSGSPGKSIWPIYCRIILFNYVQRVSFQCGLCRWAFLPHNDQYVVQQLTLWREHFWVSHFWPNIVWKLMWGATHTKQDPLVCSRCAQLPFEVCSRESRMLCNNGELILVDCTQSLSICGGHIQSRTTKNHILQAHMTSATCGTQLRCSGWWWSGTKDRRIRDNIDLTTRNAYFTFIFSFINLSV